MESSYIFIAALGEMEEDQWEQCAVDIMAYCKKYEGTSCVVLTDISTDLPEACFCGLPVQAVPERIEHTNDHYLYYQSAWLEQTIREVYAIGSIYDSFARSALQALTDLCCIRAIPCQFMMYD